MRLTVCLFGVFFLAIFTVCSKKGKAFYKKHPAGYYYRLITFENSTASYRKGYMAHVSAVYSTQHDSVFWDSFNNFNDRFFVRIDTTSSENIMVSALSSFTKGDSVSILVKPGIFFRDQFGMGVPFFSEDDSVVKVNFRILDIMPPAKYRQVSIDFQEQEEKNISQFYGSAQKKSEARDASGFYWVRKPLDTHTQVIKPGDRLKLTYRGSFLKGRFLEKSPANFEFTYGSPEQVLKGLNYVIGKLKFSQSVKIILPSRLAFGENGSSNGVVPPYTPLIYEVKVDSPGR
jgi:hypothetical protein